MIRLAEIAHARSGDKGNHANIGVIAWTTAGFAYLQQELTAEKVESWFSPLSPSKVRRYVLPGIGALNFVLEDVLGGGASRSLRTDSQGKVLALALLEMPLPSPQNLGDMLRSASASVPTPAL